MRDQIVIGHSSGWFQARFGYSKLLQSRVFSKTTSSAAEFVFNPLESFYFENGLGEIVPNHLAYRSLHLTNLSAWATLSTSKKSMLTSSCKRYFNVLNLDNATIHANAICPEKMLWFRDLGLPISIENTDVTHVSGKFPLEVISACDKYKVPLVLDVQHAYEVSCALYGEDGYFEIAEQFARLAKKYCTISQIHLSGEISYLGKVVSNHASLLHATNRSKILDILIRVMKIMSDDLPPIILEGDYIPSLEAKIYKKINTKKISDIAVTNMNLEISMVKDCLNDNFCRVKNVLLNDSHQ